MKVTVEIDGNAAAWLSAMEDYTGIKKADVLKKLIPGWIEGEIADSCNLVHVVNRLWSGNMEQFISALVSVCDRLLSLGQLCGAWDELPEDVLDAFSRRIMDKTFVSSEDAQAVGESLAFAFYRVAGRSVVSTVQPDSHGWKIQIVSCPAR